MSERIVYAVIRELKKHKHSNNMMKAKKVEDVVYKDGIYLEMR